MNEKWLKWFPSDPPARRGAGLPARIPGPKVSIAAIAAARPIVPADVRRSSYQA
jgi:2-iminobutanoate/2-iminopropanoate deaminase